MHYFLITAQQIIVLFIIILVGFFLGKKNFMDDRGAETCTNLVLYIVTPCVIIKSYIREFSPELLTSLLQSLALAFVIHGAAIVTAHIFFRPKKTESANMLRFAVVFSNAGYMALPLQEAILGADGIFFGASYVAVFNIVVWTYGVWCMNSGKVSFNIKSLLNPAILAVLVGALIFAFSVPVPKILYSVISDFAALNTPLPMLVTGFCLGKSNILSDLKDIKLYVAALFKLILIPFIAFVIMYIIKVPQTMLTSMMIAVAAPTASATTLFSIKFNGDNRLAVSLVTFTTLLSLVTMPVIVALAQYISASL